MADTAANTRRGTYRATWDGVDLGGVDEGESDLQAILLPIKIGSAGLHILDESFEGLDQGSMFTLNLREPTLAAIRKLAPWANQTAGNIVGGLPAIGARMLAFAKQMTLHPSDVADADTTQDLRIWKCVAHPEDVVLRGRDPSDFEVWPVRFIIYPDLSKTGVDQYMSIKGT